MAIILPEGVTGFEIDSYCLPEEQKHALEFDIATLRGELNDLLMSGSENDNNTPAELMAKKNRIEREIDKKEEELEALGGRTRERLIQVLGRYKPERDSEWFIRGYTDFERHQFERLLFRELAQSFPGLPIHQIVVDDRGMGTGRTLRMLMDIVKDKMGFSKMRDFAKNCHGIDLIDGNVTDTRQSFKAGRYGISDKNLIQGSYLDETDSRLDGKKAHIITCMMHSIFHLVTEEDWITFFRRVNDDLHVGGFFVFDSVAMRGVDPNERNISALTDMSDLYTSLWLEYCNANQQFMPPEINLLERKRRPIFDNTTGCGFYQREIPTVSFIMYILNKIGGSFDIHTKRRCPNTPRNDRTNELSLTDTDCTILGRKWIKENGFEGKYRIEIKKRLKEGSIHNDILSGLTDCKNENERIEAILNYIAFKMVRGYQNEYYFLHKVA